MKTERIRMRRIIGYFTLALAAVSCSYKESFPYKGDSLVNFTADSLYFSFGELPFSVTDTTLRIGVEIIGSPVSFDRTFFMSLDRERTTARSGEHYDAPATEGIIRAGMSSGAAELTIHRLALQSDSAFTVVLDMVPGDDFRLGAVENRSVAVCFTNRLDLPEWWPMLSQWLGEYNPRKYQKFIELWGGAITRSDINEMKYTILRTFKKVKEFFGEHPEYGVTFPDVEWPV